jgi:glycosyltransferase involved in cell wall biosynthesis
MKAAYITYIPKYMPGIEKAVKGRAEACLKEGLKFDFFILSEAPWSRAGNIHTIPLKYAFPDILSGLPNEIEKKFLKLMLIKRSMNIKSGKRPFHEHYDRVLLRYPSCVGPAFSAKSFSKGLEGRLFTEHHCDYPAEFKSLENNYKSDLKIYLETKNAPLFFEKVSGLIGVTDQIKNRLKGLTGISRAITVTNGINARDIKFTGFKSFNKKELTILLLASNFVSWHGFDRLLKGIDNYRGPVKIKVIAAGRFEQSLFQTKNPNAQIICTGMISGSDLNNAFMQSNLAASTLAIHRADLTEACVLKSREYAARGMPFIFAGKDIDFPGHLGFCRSYSLDDTPIDIENVIEFAEKSSQKGSDLSFEMRKWAEKELNWNTRMKKISDFLINPEVHKN